MTDLDVKVLLLIWVGLRYVVRSSYSVLHVDGAVPSKSSLFHLRRTRVQSVYIITGTYWQINVDTSEYCKSMSKVSTLDTSAPSL